jgi:CIC family chloride channel protein
MDREKNDARDLIRLVLVAALAGFIVGIVGGYFRKFLFEADDLRLSFLTWAHDWSGPGWLLLIVVVVVCVVLARLIVLAVPRVSGSGIQDVEAVFKGEIAATSWEVLPAKFVGGVLAIGAGLALGREGPTVHLGAAIGSEAGRQFRLDDQDVRLLQTALGGAGLGVAFNAPLGGALFVFEEVAKTIRLRLGLVTLIGTAAAITASRLVLGDRPDFLVGQIGTPSGWTLVAFLAFGVVTGIAGAWYNRLIMFFLGLSDRMHRVPPLAQAAVIGVVVGALLWFDPLVATGGGDRLTQELLGGGIALASVTGYFLIRFFLGPLSYAVQTPGGLFSPLLAVGALWGAILHGLGGHFLSGPGTGVAAFAIVGMSTLFAAMVRAPLTGIILIVEMTAATTLVVPMLAAAFGAVITTSLMRNEPIYDSLGRRMMASLSPLGKHEK